MDIKKETRENAEIALIGTLPKADIEVFWDNALKRASKEISLPGFRKGHVPEAKVVEEVGEDFLWKEASEMALKDSLEDILKKEEIIPIAPLSLQLKNPKKDTDVEFEIVAVTPPTCDAGDYKGAAKKAIEGLPKEEPEKEIAEAKKAFRIQIRAISKMQKPEEVKEGDAKENEDKGDEPISDEESKMVGMENGKAAEHFLEEEAKKAVADRAMQKKRGAIAEALIAEAKAEIPKLLVEDETKALVDVFKKDVVNQGMEWNDYLTRVKKTETQVMDDLRPNARKRIVLDLVFSEIVKKEDLKPEEADKEREDEIAHALTKQGVEHQKAHQYAREQLVREKAWEVLGAKNESVVS